MPPRRLHIVVGSLTIEDGTTCPPAVGAVDRYTLSFYEAGTDDSSAAVVTVAARAEPAGDGSPRGPGYQWDGTPHEGPTTWLTLLHGDGWSATWSAPRPVIGQVRLRGRLVDDLNIGVRTGVRGRVTRVRVITETVDTTSVDRHRWSPIPAEQRLREVEVAPRWFDHGLVAPTDALTTGWYSPVPADPYVVETGVLVDLDLDHVPAVALRPSIVPGALATAGDALWVCDVRLPVAVRIRHPLAASPLVTEFGWDGRILSAGEYRSRALHADLEGCWITGPGGIHRADSTGSVEQVSDRPVTAAVARDGLLLAQVLSDTADLAHRPTLRLVDPAGPVTGVSLDDASLVTAVAAAEEPGFLLLLRHHDHRPDPASGAAGGQVDGRPWLARLSPEGDLRTGPYLEVGHPGLIDLLAGDPPVLVDREGAGLRRVHDDLSVGGGSSRWRNALRGYATDGRLWVAAHPPHPRDIDRCGPEAYWPLAEPPTYPEERQYWLLTELDPLTLDPTISALVQHVPDYLTLDGAGTVWVQAARIRHLRSLDGAAAELVDIAAILDRHRGT